MSTVQELQTVISAAIDIAQQLHDARKQRFISLDALDEFEDWAVHAAEYLDDEDTPE